MKKRRREQNETGGVWESDRFLLLAGKKKNTVNAMREVLMNYKQDGHLPLVLKIEEII